MKDKYSDFTSALQFQTVAPFVLSSQIPEKHYREVYNKLVYTHEEFDFAIFTKIPNTWTEKETKQFLKSKKNILIRPIHVDSKDFRNLPVEKYQESKSNRFNIFFNPQYENQGSLLFLKALCHILKIWKSLVKQVEYQRIQSESKEETETKSLSVRLSNKFDSEKFAAIIQDVSGFDLSIISEKIFIIDEHKENIGCIQNISSIKDQYIVKKETQDHNRTVYQKTKGSHKEVRIDCIPEPISLEEKIKDDYGNFFNRYLIRSITIAERITLSLGSSEVSLQLPSLTSISNEILQRKRPPKILRNFENLEEMVNYLESNLQTRSLLLVLYGKKFFFCCSDTLKNNIPITSNRHIGFTNSGNNFTGYKMSNGDLNPYYKVQGGGEILIDGALIPKNSTIIALRSCVDDDSFMGIADFEPKKTDKARAVAYRNHEVHILEIPKRAILGWRKGPGEPWESKIPVPLIRDLRTNEVFTPTVESQRVLENPTYIKEQPRRAKRKHNPEQKEKESSKKKLCVVSSPKPEVNQEIDQKLFTSSNPFLSQDHSLPVEKKPLPPSKSSENLSSTLVAFFQDVKHIKNTELKTSSVTSQPLKEKLVSNSIKEKPVSNSSLIGKKQMSAALTEFLKNLSSKKVQKEPVKKRCTVDSTLTTAI